MQTNLSSGNLVADKRADYARMLGESGDFQAAAEVMQQALELANEWAAGWFQAGEYFENAGDAERALDAFNRVLAASPEDKFGARLKLAYLRGETLAFPHTAYVEALFDDYAEKFDKSLVERLKYRVPELLAEMVERSGPNRKFKHCIDLGCGTGLMAQALGAKSDRTTGVDLSAAMLAKADGKGLYTKLIKADLIDGIAAAGQADLIIAADVFMYLGPLQPVMQAAACHLSDAGRFAFSIELNELGNDCQLRASMRYAHSSNYIVACLRSAGFIPLEMRAEIIRMDGETAIEGLLVIAHKSKSRMSGDG